MLRIDQKLGVIPVDYEDPYLELVRLLTEGAALEHSLMVAYLYSLFSLKDEYANVRGDVTHRSYLEHSPAGRGGNSVLLHHDTFLDVALEEMQHLAMVNGYLSALTASPNFIPHIWPYSSDIYPFDIALVPMSQYTAATYLWVEADSCALSLAPRCKGSSEPKEFILNVRRVLATGAARRDETPIDKEKPNHVGSLYNQIMKFTQIVAKNPPAFVPADFPWADWERKMGWIIGQGEIAHYRFFRSVFTGEAFGGDESIWKDPKSKKYPSHQFAWRTAYKGHPDSIPDENARRLAWLADLHYWIILTLLDNAYREPGFNLRYKATDNMTMGLWHLGLWLANKYQVGLPFDPMGPQYTLGRDLASSKNITVLLVKEAQRHAEALAKDGLLPPNYELKVFPLTLAGLGAS